MQGILNDIACGTSACSIFTSYAYLDMRAIFIVLNHRNIYDEKCVSTCVRSEPPSNVLCPPPFHGGCVISDREFAGHSLPIYDY